MTMILMERMKKALLLALVLLMIFGGTDRTMMSMDAELQRLVREGRITREIALLHAANPDTLAKRI